MSVSCESCLAFFTILLSINSQKLFEVAGTARIAAKHCVFWLTRPGQFHALIYINNCPTRCDIKQSISTVEGGSCTKNGWPVPEAVVTISCTPDDGCVWHPKHVEWTCGITNRLLCVASRWTVINIILANHLILFCYHRSITNETPGVTPKEDVKQGQVKASRWSQTTPPPPPIPIQQPRNAGSVWFFTTCVKWMGTPWCRKQTRGLPICPAAVPTPIFIRRIRFWPHIPYSSWQSVKLFS